MNIGLYIVIFVSKVIENALATLRLIVVANGKKKIGALLQGIIAVVWVIVTGVVVIDITKDPLKIVFFALGSFVGSYIGSLIEEKIALGSNMLTVVIDKEKEIVIDTLRDLGYIFTVIDGKGKRNNRSVLIIMIPRKGRMKLIHKIKELDRDAWIMVENAYAIKM